MTALQCEKAPAMIEENDDRILSLMSQMIAGGKLGVCIKDKHRRVVAQNRACQQLCGDQVSAVCTKNCMESYVQSRTNPAQEEGTQYFAAREFDGKFFDVFFINDRDQLVTLLFNLEGRLKREKEFFRIQGLTPRESQIAVLISQGKTNPQIRVTLRIKKSTLKTHLNNIYRKLPGEMISLRRKKASEIT